jgi:hypothetical protein
MTGQLHASVALATTNEFRTADGETFSVPMTTQLGASTPHGNLLTRQTHWKNVGLRGYTEFARCFCIIKKKTFEETCVLHRSEKQPVQKEVKLL